MSTLDGFDLFSSGPHSLKVSAWPRQLQRRSVPGVDGEFVLDLGRRARSIVQQGRLQASSLYSLRELIEKIEEFADGELHELIDNFGQVYPQVLLEKFEPASAPQIGRGFWCDYTLTYLQLP